MYAVARADSIFTGYIDVALCCIAMLLLCTCAGSAEN